MRTIRVGGADVPYLTSEVDGKLGKPVRLLDAEEVTLYWCCNGWWSWEHTTHLAPETNADTLVFLGEDGTKVRLNRNDQKFLAT